MVPFGAGGLAEVRMLAQQTEGGCRFSGKSSVKNKEIGRLIRFLMPLL
jgi:hypothetical protein